MNVLELPQELLGRALSFLGPADIVRFGQTCQLAWAFIDPANVVLWQSAFLQVFDDPQDAWMLLTPTARESRPDTGAQYNWHAQLKRRLQALQAIDAKWTGELLSSNGPTPDEVIDAILDIIDTAKSRPTRRELQLGKRPETDDRSSRNIALLPTPYSFSVRFDRLVRGSYENSSETGAGVWHSPGRPTTRAMASAPGPRSEAACRLHVLGGVTEQEAKDNRALGAARRSVYDWDLTNSATEYGPLKEDGSGNVDWHRLDAVCTVVTRHFSRAAQGRMTIPQGYQYSIPHRTLGDPMVPDDWAGVTGTWCGTYVFLNYEDLLTYNTLVGPRSPTTLEDGPEASGGLMKLELKLDESLADDPVLQSGFPICTDLPPLYFSGISKNDDEQYATAVRGMACLTPSGREVRWRIIVQ